MVAEPISTPNHAPAGIGASRQRVFSGIQPSGNFHLGNYLGAIRNWVRQQGQYDNFFCIVDLHALSLPTTAEMMRANITNLASVLLASGLDPHQSVIFVQSDVHEHSELCWLLNSVTQFGELRRMTQFKDKAGDNVEGISAALFDYPVLMAADILLYDAHYVPVGEDQKQHLELTRDVANRFNQRYGDTFVVPKPDIKEAGARIMSLDNPTKKMSKSSGVPASYIALTDRPDEIRKKIKRAVTDSGTEVVAGPDKPALTNLLTIYSLVADEPVASIEARYAGKGYGQFKTDLAEAVVAAIQPIQERLVELEADPDAVRAILAHGAAQARAVAAPKMAKVKERMGLGSGA